MKFIFSFLFLFSTLAVAKVEAQQSRFLFIQTDNRQPFNITIDKKVYSSTASGYLIVPKLQEGQYSIVVGFGGNAVAEQTFNIDIGRKDAGYELKKLGDRGWGLFNLQSLEITMAGAPPKQQEVTVVSAPVGSSQPKPEIKRQEPQNTTEANRNEPVNGTDKTVATASKKTPIIGKEMAVATPKEENDGSTSKQKEVPVSKVEEIAAKPSNIGISKSDIQPKPSIETGLSGSSKSVNVQKISQIQGAEAYYITYTDVNASGVDTIQVLVPNIKAVGTSAKSGEQTKPGPKFLEIEARQQTPEAQASKEAPPVAQSSTPVIATQPQSSTPSVATPASQKCIATATSQDFLSLRKNMAAGNNDDEMMSEAKKTFKSLCFSTMQVKNLSFLFLTDQGRYQFFDLAYPHVSDQREFSSLSSELTDPYYINRFKAMLIN